MIWFRRRKYYWIPLLILPHATCFIRYNQLMYHHPQSSLYSLKHFWANIDLDKAYISIKIRFSWTLKVKSYKAWPCSARIVSKTLQVLVWNIIFLKKGSQKCYRILLRIISFFNILLYIMVIVTFLFKTFKNRAVIKTLYITYIGPSCDNI